MVRSSRSFRSDSRRSHIPVGTTSPVSVTTLREDRESWNDDPGSISARMRVGTYRSRDTLYFMRNSPNASTPYTASSGRM